MFDFTKRECESLVKVGLTSISAVQGLMKSIIRVISMHVLLIRFSNATLFDVTSVEGGVLSTSFLIDCFLYVAFLHHTKIPNETSDVQFKWNGAEKFVWWSDVNQRQQLVEHRTGRSTWGPLSFTHSTIPPLTTIHLSLTPFAISLTSCNF